MNAWGKKGNKNESTRKLFIESLRYEYRRSKRIWIVISCIATYGIYSFRFNIQIHMKYICSNCGNRFAENELCQKPIFNKLSHKTEYETACPVCGCIGIYPLALRGKHEIPPLTLKLFDWQSCWFSKEVITLLRGSC